MRHTDGMTRLWLMSDLHLEFHRDGGRAFFDALEPPECDALVLAGDILSLSDETAAHALLSRFAQLAPRLLYVPGNHEYYGSSPAEADRVLAELEAQLPTLDVLRAGRVLELNGQRVLGDTLWFERSDDPSWREYSRWLMDFETIRGFEPWVYERHAELLRFLDEELRADDVVITHHMPSLKCVHPKFEGSPLNPFFVSDQEKLIRERRPKVWIHGHTHERVDVHLGDTRIVGNPRGYPREERETVFDPALVVCT